MQPNIPTISIVRGSKQPAFLFSVVSSFPLNTTTMPMNNWFLNELLCNPRFWATIRTFVRLSQAEFGKEVGVSRQLVSRWETELSIPARQHTIRAQVVLERHLQVTLAQMKTKLEDKFRDAATV